MDRQQPWFVTGAGHNLPPPTHNASVVHTAVLKWKHGWYTQDHCVRLGYLVVLMSFSHVATHIFISKQVKYCIFLMLLLDECGTMWEQAWVSPSQLVHGAVDKGRPYQRYVTTHIVTDGTPAHGWYNNGCPTSCKMYVLMCHFLFPWRFMTSLTFFPPYLQTGSDQILKVAKAWEWGYPTNLYQLDGAHKTTNWLILGCSL